MENDLTKIESCTNNVTSGCDSHASAVFVSLNVISIIINLLHILILTTMSELRKRNYFWILLNLTLTDILASVAFSVGVSCMFYQLQMYADSKIASGVILLAMDTTSLSRYFQLTLASLDRFYAVCRPFDYNDSKLLKNIGKLFLLSWIVILSLGIANIFVSSDMCFSKVGPFLGKQGDTNYMQVVLVFAIVIPSVATAVLLGKAMNELRAMKKRRNMSEEDREVRSATKYIIVSCILFYSTVVLTFTFVVINISMNIKTDVNRVFQWVAVAFHTLYGVGNVIMYGWLNPAYLTTIRSMFNSFHCKVTESSG